MNDVELMKKADKLIKEVSCMRVDMIRRILMNYKVDNDNDCRT